MFILDHSLGSVAIPITHGRQSESDFLTGWTEILEMLEEHLKMLHIFYKIMYEYLGTSLLKTLACLCISIAYYCWLGDKHVERNFIKKKKEFCSILKQISILNWISKYILKSNSCY